MEQESNPQPSSYKADALLPELPLNWKCVSPNCIWSVANIAVDFHENGEKPNIIASANLYYNNNKKMMNRN